MRNQSLGQMGEVLACQYLLGKGYMILDKNFRNKLGEIDLVAKDGKTICFIEIKTRRSSEYGEPFLAVNSTKQHKMVQLALSYLKYKFRSTEVLSRFDVISIHFKQEEPILNHLVNAFDLSYLSH